LFKIHFKVCWSKVKKKSPKGEAVQLWEKMFILLLKQWLLISKISVNVKENKFTVSRANATIQPS